MRALVLTAPHTAEVVQLPGPEPGPGEVVVDVERAGVCGTDVELWTGAMSYLHSGEAGYPIRPGHEWCGRVAALGPGVDPVWSGRRVTGDTMIGCTRCDRCRRGRHHVCEDRWEVGLRHGFPGALAEQLVMPARSLLAVPEAVSPAAAALVEPGAGALRAVRAAGLSAGARLLVLGAGSIGLLTLLFAAAAGAEVTVCDTRPQALGLAAELDARVVPPEEVSGAGPYDAVVDASTGSSSPGQAVELVEPGGRVVWIGLAPDLSPMDARRVTLKDVTVTGILGGSAALAGVIAAYADGSVVPDRLVADVVGLEQVAAVLDGRHPRRAAGPKIQVVPGPV